MPFMTSAATRRLLIDTDPGIDDAMALLFLRAIPNVRIAAITTVFGNANIEVTTRNACYLAERFGIDAPVIAGAERPLIAERVLPPLHVHGDNGLGGVSLHSSVQREVTPGFAPQRIAELVRESPHTLSLLALGPLTNLALALRQDPEIASLVREVVVMGGVLGFNGRRGNVSPVAEANIRNDPDAADEVLSARWPVTLVGLDVTAGCVLTSDEARRLASEAGEVGQFLWDISRGYEAMYREHDGIDGCSLHDVAAAAYWVEPQLFSTRRGPIRVVTQGIAVGQTIQRPATHSYGPGPWDSASPQSACCDVDVQGVLKLYTNALTSKRT